MGAETCGCRCHASDAMADPGRPASVHGSLHTGLCRYDHPLYITHAVILVAALICRESRFLQRTHLARGLRDVRERDVRRPPPVVSGVYFFRVTLV